jgi:hypothetical protein
MSLFGYDIEKSFDYENGFYLTSDISRIGKIIAHYELYKLIKKLDGDLLEFGVFKGVSLIKWATFRELFERSDTRKIIGFDIFDKFPKTNFEKDKKLRKDFMEAAGETSISKEELYNVLKLKKFNNIELIKGDILNTVPDYNKKNKNIKISLMHIDVDIYEPSKVILQELYDKVVEGGVIVLDDYGKFPGETKAVDDFFKFKSIKIQSFPFLKNGPSFIIKD